MSFDAPLLADGFGVDDGLGFLCFGGGFKLGTLFRFDALGVGEGGFGQGKVFRLEDGRFGDLCFCLAIWKASACLTLRVAFESAMFAWDVFSPSMAWALAPATATRI